ncbi:UDP-3-O-acylglucosamine N-acyltransferase 1 [Synergistales bacterium]|nr:UDP-3-O-acylglucosamine N-acyltransferase 1 [Synergistales bacterium]
MEKNFSVTLTEIGEKLGLDVIGDGSKIVNGVSAPEDASPDKLCVIWDTKNANLDNAIPVIGRHDFFDDSGRTGLASADPRAALPGLLSLFAWQPERQSGVHPSAVVSPHATVSPEAWVGPMCVVENEAVIEAHARLDAGVYVGSGAVVGARTVIEAQAVLMYGTRVGENCLLHAHCVLGCDGFGFIPTVCPDSPSGRKIIKIPQVGNVIVEDNVEIGAFTAIDRGAIGDTIIGSGTKIANHVQIGHSVKIGRDCIICSMSGIGGSSVVEDGVTVSVQVGINDHVRIGKGALLGGRTGAANDVAPNAVVSGFPARPHNEARKALVLAARLPDIYERVKSLERVITKTTGGKEKK